MKSKTRLRALGATTTAAVVATLALSNAAVAAPPYATEATLSVEFSESTVASGSEAQLQGTWTLPDNALTPAGFVVDLPAGLQGLAEEFPLLDPDDVAMGDCIVSATEIVCDIDSGYLTEHPLNVSGTFLFWASVQTVVTEDTEVTYSFGDTETTVTVTPNPEWCVEDCGWQGEPTIKWGEYNRDDDTIMWTVQVASDEDGTSAGQVMRVEDVLGPNQEMLTSYNGETFPQLRKANDTVTWEDGYEVPGPWVNADASEYTVTDAGATVSWTAEEGYFYSIIFMSQVTDAGVAVTYSNRAHSFIDGDEQSAFEEVNRHGGSGTGQGDTVGRFSVSKEVIWDDEPIADLTYEVNYTVTSPGGDAFEGEFALAENETWTSEEFETGSIVELGEITPTAPANIDWALPVFSANDFAIVGAETTPVVLTNQAAVARSFFSAHKVLEGTGAALADDVTFYLDYTYEAGVGFAAGSGVLELPADGTLVYSEEIPVGAVVTVTERTPADVDATTWSAPQLSSTTFTIERGEVVEVSVTNTLTADVVEEPEEPVEEEGELAVTGADAPLIALAVALLLLAGGSLALRRRVA